MGAVGKLISYYGADNCRVRNGLEGRALKAGSYRQRVEFSHY